MWVVKLGDMGPLPISKLCDVLDVVSSSAAAIHYLVGHVLNRSIPNVLLVFRNGSEEQDWNSGLVTWAATFGYKG